MPDALRQFADTYLMWQEGPMIWISDVLILLTSIGIVATLTYFKKWKWLWREWLTTVDHKKIGIMYLIAALLMMFRGGADGLLMRTQLAAPGMHFLDAEHYDQIFTTHGTIMILFMAMPFIFALFNIVVPLQIGARDVAFPYLNAISFWLFFFGALLLNISFVFGGSPDAGWTSYPPLSELGFDNGPGENFYLLALQISGIGSIATGINFLVTILRMRAPGMTLMKMPLFTWSVLSACIMIIFAFPALTVALALLMLDRIVGTHFFTILQGGNPMMFINLFWIWGHPEVYIVVVPAFGVFSEVVATFARKRIFGYTSMVAALLSISVISYFVWAHHFFTMGAGADVNTFFAVATMAVGIPTGVKVFNWLFTMYRGRIRMTLPMLWTIAFVPCFVIGGATGVMLAVAPADYQYHNSYFLIAHFHQVLIGGVVFGMLAGMYYWWPKMFGFKLDERLGRWAFWFFNIGFYVCFMPQYALGFMGMQRRMYTYPADMGWGTLNFVSTIGAYLMGIGFIFIVAQVLYSIKYGERDLTGDPWDGRTLEWSLPSPVPHYNFAVIPTVTSRDYWWTLKEEGRTDEIKPKPEDIQPIHMPKNSGRPFLMGVLFFVAGLGFVFNWHVLAVLGLLGVVVTMLRRSFEYDDEYYIQPEEIQHVESALGRL
ncbi:cytochrome aa3 quinol oxidase subunit I [Alicyclobacillus macrosporangiidus]|jgi:cytochrome aa3-600 menaquinol oxidase subunit 1|uniref:Quinol oxidase subunit 1 n=1 Tax=Alicyclobacillus macrosporangiidus TaxID=392015 RepID=A0A1I7F4Q1_9BACL|nr:cytochrome aa3 quinol oxidase subunit I [Alicyclobacillus macrosporangiidus]SFU31124.1 cytochrome aa3-600 menaquinol oxidase subunit 1 [Alicyclobacillus macrosporangiidus]